MTTTAPGDGLSVEFGPLERRGVLLGVSGPSLAAIAAGLPVAFGCLFALGGSAGVLAAAAVLGAALAFALAPLRGATAAEWAVLVTGYLWRVATGRSSWRSATPTTGILAVPPAEAATLALSGRSPRRGARPSPRASTTARIPAAVSVDLPAELARARTRVVAVPWGDAAAGVILDGGLAVGVLRARSAGAFLMMEPADQAALTGRWAELIGSVADPGSPWVRLAWIDTTTPVDDGALAAFVADAACPAARTPGTAQCAARAAYEQLLHRTAPATEAHDVLLALALDPRRVSRQVRDAGGGDAGTARVTVRALEQVAYKLAGGDILVDGLLTARQVGQVLREHVDPSERRYQSTLTAHPTGHRGPDPTGSLGPDAAGDNGWPARDDALLDPAMDPDIEAGPGCGVDAGMEPGFDPGSGWTLVGQEGFGVHRTDGAVHTTLWVAEWPRRPARVDFLAPLLLRTGTITRSIAVVMAPVETGAALRAVEGAATADESDEALRARFGIRTSARRAREQDMARRREDELVDGYDDVRFSAYLTVSAPTLGALEADVAEVHAQARAARLRLVRLAGQQAEAFWYTAPLCRGVR
jgi:hypothetical protein